MKKYLTNFCIVISAFIIFQYANCQMTDEETFPDYLKSDLLNSEDDIFWSEDFINPVWQNPDVTAVAAFGNNIYSAENGKIITYKFNTNTWHQIGSIGSGIIYAMANFDSLIYVGGSFEIIEGKRVNFIAKWDGTQLSALGKGLNKNVYSIAVDRSGIVYAGGDFNSSDNIDTLNHFAFWDGEKWNAPKEQPDGRVRAICVKGDSVIIGGDFEMIGDKEFLKVAVWDRKQNQWFPLGNGIESGQGKMIRTLTTDDEGNIYAGGLFSYAGDVEVANLAVFDGLSWKKVGDGAKGIVNSLVFLKNKLYAGGSFSTIGGKNIPRIAFWDGVEWKALKNGVDGGEYPSVSVLCPFEQSSLLVGGTFNMAGEISCNGLALWNGTDWVDLFKGKRNGVVSIVYDMVIDENNLLYVGGAFVKTGDKASRGLSVWDGENWLGCRKGLDPPAVVYSVKSLGSDIYFTGWFFGADSVKLNNVAKWLGKEQRWVPIGPGIDGGDGTLGPILISGSEIFVGGRFITSGDLILNHITYWDGSKWNDMEGGINNRNASISTIVDAGNGQIYITGAFDTVAGVRTPYFAVWDKNIKKWIEPPLRFNGIPGTILVDNDSVYFGGSFTNVNGVEARNLILWDRKANSLHRFPDINGSVSSIVKWFDDLYIGGRFTTVGNLTVNSIFKYNLKTGEIESLGTGLKQGLNAGRVSKLIIYKNALYVGGMFTNAGGKLSSNFAKWSKIRASCDDYDSNPHNFIGYITNNSSISIELAIGDFLENVEIYNCLGQKIKTFNINELVQGESKIKLNFGEINKGLYICKLYYQKAIQTIKVMNY
mgnify:CR=1 FL=1